LERFQGITDRHKIALDISQWQGNINFDTLASRNPLAVIVRSYGAVHNTGGDTRAKEYATQLRARGIPVGSYFYAWIDYVEDLETARYQAELFKNKLYEIFGDGDTGDIIPMLDLETTNGVGTRTHLSGVSHDNLDTAKMLTWANEFRRHFESITNTKLGLYTAHYWIEHHKNFLGDQNPLKDMPLWIAAFTKYGYSLEQGLRKVGGWDRWLGWQFSEDGNGAHYGVQSATIDLNYFEPLEEWKPEFYLLPKNRTEPTEPEPTEPTPQNNRKPKITPPKARGKK
jgi:GH25 family lysozyme M1 (1,4-beta-N-acetylmuramidase)